MPALPLVKDVIAGFLLVDIRSLAVFASIPLFLEAALAPTMGALDVTRVPFKEQFYLSFYKVWKVYTDLSIVLLMSVVITSSLKYSFLLFKNIKNNFISLLTTTYSVTNQNTIQELCFEEDYNHILSIYLTLKSTIDFIISVYLFYFDFYLNFRCNLI